MRPFSRSKAVYVCLKAPLIRFMPSRCKSLAALRSRMYSKWPAPTTSGSGQRFGLHVPDPLALMLRFRKSTPQPHPCFQAASAPTWACCRPAIATRRGRHPQARARHRHPSPPLSLSLRQLRRSRLRAVMTTTTMIAAVTTTRPRSTCAQHPRPGRSESMAAYAASSPNLRAERGGG